MDLAAMRGHDADTEVAARAGGGLGSCVYARAVVGVGERWTGVGCVHRVAIVV